MYICMYVCMYVCTCTCIYIYLIHGGEEWTFPDLLLGTFKNENNVLNTFISVCNI